MIGSTALIAAKNPKTLSRNCCSRIASVVAFDRSADVGAGVVDQDVDAAKCFVRLGDERIDRGFVGHIGWNAEHAIAGAGEFVHGVIEPLRVAGADRDRASFR